MAATGTSAATAAERKRMEAVVETLAAMHHHGESLAELTHDARNMVTALSLYCDLLEEPGVLASSHHHYVSELRLVTEASRRLVEKLTLLDCGEGEGVVSPRQDRLFSESADDSCPPVSLDLEPVSGALIDDLREEVLASRGLLAAIASPSIRVTVTADGGNRPVRMTGENLVRALVNLIRNSVESIRGTGAIHLGLAECRDTDGSVNSLVIALEDTGSGIADELLEKIFEPGFTTRLGDSPDGTWPGGHRGLGLSITRSIIEAAGGCIRAEKRTPQGTRFVIDLPVRKCSTEWTRKPEA